jgi:hypothetical protein
LQGNEISTTYGYKRFPNDHLCPGRDCHEFSQSPLQLNIITVISKVDGFVACEKTSGGVRDGKHRTDTLYKIK